MLKISRPFSLLSANSFFGSVKCSTLGFMLQVIKQKRFIVAIPSLRTQKSTLTIFGYKKLDSAETYHQSYIDACPKNLKVISCLSKMFHCTEEEIYGLIQNHNLLENLQDVQINNLENCYEKLKKYGMEKVTIKNNVWTLFFNTHQLTSRLELLKKWRFSNINNAVGMLRLSFKMLKKHTFQTEQELEFLDSQNRISYFSLFIKCDEKEACDLFLKYRFIMVLSLESFKTILKLTEDVGVLKEDLLSDPWLFKYHPQFIASRILHLNAIGAKEKCKVIKPWMLRCPQSTVDRYFELRDENLAALGSYTNIKDLLSNELELSDAEVEEMFAKHPPLAKISYSKAKEMIDFLKTQGFRSKMIYQVPRVLCHKQATLLARMLELKKINPRMMSLQNLCRNKKDYLAFLNKVQSPHS